MYAPEMELLQWARGPGMVIASSIMIFGIVLRLIELFSLSRKADLSAPSSHPQGSGWRTLVMRSFPTMAQIKHEPVIIAAYLFHLGLFAVVLLFVPHIEFFRGILGISWPGLPIPVIDAISVISIICMLILLAHRLTNPVKRLLSTWGDYLAWVVTFLPFLTGYLAFHHLLFDYTTILALHILSVELLMVVLPFSKLFHTISAFISRWYTGANFARKGVSL
jgi:nitrate reductase gamma subunit